MKPRSPIPKIKPRRRAQRAEYTKAIARYLREHPFDQIRIAVLGFDEDEILRDRRDHDWRCCSGIMHQGRFIPCATQIHHRNKCYGARLLDERWWMATSTTSHEYVERHLSWAREEGYSLPIQADADGKWGDGCQAFDTPTLMKIKRR